MPALIPDRRSPVRPARTVGPLPRALLALVLLVPALLVLVPTPGLAAPVDPADPADPVGQWPLRPRPQVVAGFDPPGSPWGAGHRGVDLLGRPGQSVHSALAGVVTFAGVIAGRGVVVVDHGETRTTYEPVRAAVTVGTPLAAGDRLGILEGAGSHCLPRTCLHWGWLRGPAYLDPLRLVGAGPVRLLPLWRAAPSGFVAVPGPLAPASPYAGWLPLGRLFR
ncbi:M23 family metallopeptidase [Nocardioides panaciterrulae]|uniref:Murein DD-endopeptidase MepM/ murein hydrolase activator NlpD n=1 Tax=Nocardioides panaciterrulae TaxID=661492 RepID=A0A7Y9JBP6_9ACTN|nr:M23 family metallopeptidase [Nocardioides panaciterrulae]NYD42411.1 murein DD-endopeptidase MepM/ murein hydrolase activator NlpD [Nocardioides panaciterrulae]